MTKITALFLSANPTASTQLELAREFREITDKIRASEHRDLFKLESAWAVRPDDLLQSLNLYQPQIVHFSGHGSTAGEIILVDSSGAPKPVPTNALQVLFTTLKDNIRVVIMNACYSEIQAEAIIEVIDCAIGMNANISDQAAITFVASFYRAIGFGRSIQDAFDQGKTALLLEGISEDDIPQLLIKTGIDPSQITLVETTRSPASAQASVPAISLPGPLRTVVEETGFLGAYLTFISPDIELTDRYSDIITRQYDQLRAEIKKLEAEQDWDTLLLVKQRLREYFEYSGKYLQGVEFGEIYVQALERLGNIEEAIWAKVKNVGYLLVLAGCHARGRIVLIEALDQLKKLPNANLDSLHECLFYCHRYLGVSYHRDTLSPDIDKAKYHYSEAKTYIDRFADREPKQKALQGRLLGNLGNIALTEHEYRQALSNYEQSLKIFIDIDDKEHIGIAKLRVAQTLISYGEREPENALPLLEEANVIFMEIGWIEGQARVGEQFARCFERMARKTRSSNKKYAFTRDALSAISRSEALFKRIGDERGIGRVEELRRRIEGI